MHKRSRWRKFTDILLLVAVCAFVAGNFYLVYIVVGKLWERFIGPAAATNGEHHPTSQPEGRGVSSMSARIRWRTNIEGEGHRQSHKHRHHLVTKTKLADNGAEEGWIGKGLGGGEIIRVYGSLWLGCIN